MPVFYVAIGNGFAAITIGTIAAERRESAYDMLVAFRRRSGQR